MSARGPSPLRTRGRTRRTGSAAHSPPSSAAAGDQRAGCTVITAAAPFSRPLRHGLRGWAERGREGLAGVVADRDEGHLGDVGRDAREGGYLGLAPKAPSRSTALPP